MTSTAWPVSFDLGEPGRERWASHWQAQRGPVAARLAGRLHDASALRRTLGVDAPAADDALDDALLVVLAYERWGEGCFARLRGAFVVVLVDAARNRVIAVRDPMGIHPLFYASGSGRVTVGTSPQQLIRLGGVAGDIHRAVVADALCRRHLNPHETFFQHVTRLPAGFTLVVGGGRTWVERFWDPAPSEGAVAGLREDAQAAFDELQARAISRCCAGVTSAILLSGGVDSASIAVAARDGAQTGSIEAPVALSLGFRDPSCDERPLQRAVAAELGLRQVLLDLDDLVAPARVIEESLALSATLPFPLLNLLAVPYDALVGRAGADVDTVLTGTGGDEWLSVSGYFAADLITHGRAMGFYRFARTWAKTYGAAASLFYTYGLRPIASDVLGRVATQPWMKSKARRLVASDPAWISPGPGLRREQVARVHAFRHAQRRGTFALAETRQSFDSTHSSLEMEELHALGSRRGVQYLHPYLDPDLVQVCCATPPEVLNAGGALKGLLRTSLRRRLPDLHLEDQPKRLATSYFREIYGLGVRGAWASVQELRALGDHGIVDPVAAAAVIRAEDPGSGKIRSWDLMNMEMWLRAQAG